MNIIVQLTEIIFFYCRTYLICTIQLLIMFLQSFEISDKSLVADVVAQDYRTADVFRRYGISYCCGGKWPIDRACEMKGVDADKLHRELEVATRTIQVSSQLSFADWDIDFLISYLINVHHHFLKKSLPETQRMLVDFSNEHKKQLPYLIELEKQFDLLIKQLITSMQREEEVIFPYIHQIAHAHTHSIPPGDLLITTLRKPVEEIMYHGHEIVWDIILSIRKLTSSYTIPENSCISHKVVIAKLRELDNDLIQHLYLEQSILFSKAITIEKQVLSI